MKPVPPVTKYVMVPSPECASAKATIAAASARIHAGAAALTLETDACYKPPDIARGHGHGEDRSEGAIRAGRGEREEAARTARQRHDAEALCLLQAGHGGRRDGREARLLRLRRRREVRRVVEDEGDFAGRRPEEVRRPRQEARGLSRAVALATPLLMASSRRLRSEQRKLVKPGSSDFFPLPAVIPAKAGIHFRVSVTAKNGFPLSRE